MERMIQDLARFLVVAKRESYAAGGSASRHAVAPLLAGSHQLEYREGERLYRDVYFGESHFAGQEVVYLKGCPIWSMCYAGGWTDALDDRDEITVLAGVLQSALRQVSELYPFRGPLRYSMPPYLYSNSYSGSLAAFEGRETIDRGGIVLYQLSYVGGAVD